MRALMQIVSGEEAEPTACPAGTSGSTLLLNETLSPERTAWGKGLDDARARLPPDAAMVDHRASYLRGYGDVFYGLGAEAAAAGRHHADLAAFPREGKAFYRAGCGENRPRPPPSAKRIAARLEAGLSQALAAIVSPSDLMAAFAIFREGHAVDSVITVAARDVDEACDAVAAGLAKIARASQGGTLTLHRALTVEKTWARGLAKPCALGLFWTLDEQFTIGEHGIEHEDGGAYVALSAQAPLSSLDWPQTIVKQVDGVEDEVVLRQDAPVRLVHVDPEPEPGWKPAEWHTA